MLKIVQTVLAEQDLTDIWVYTSEEWSLAQADTYLDEIASVILTLTEHPRLGHARDDLKKGYRALPTNQHIVFYKVLEDEIQIIRVLHKSVDVPQHV